MTLVAVLVAGGRVAGMGVEALLEWYEAVRRPLPWRFTRDPWAILVAEVMLQQTQAERVVPYYERFLARFPAPGALAAAPAAEAIAAWSGLGYNRRVLALRAAAGVVAERGWPEPERLEELPGVGPYTAAAVGSFAWDAPMAAVDTNVRRVIERRDGVRRVAARAGAPRGRAPARGPGGRLESGDDGARGDGLPPAPAALRRMPAAGGLRRAGRGRAGAAAARRALRGQRPLGARAPAGRARGR